jgi:hypothetical protein
MFPTSEVLAIRVDSPERADSAAYASMQAELLRRTEAMPGVVGVTFASSLPFRAPSVYIEVQGATDVTGARASSARSHRVDVAYFDVLGVPLLAGRPFERADLEDEATATLVNRSFVSIFMPDGGALGRRFRESSATGGESDGSEPWFEVVGIVEDMFEPDRRGRTMPGTFHPLASDAGPLMLAARVRDGDPTAVTPRILDIVEDLAPGYQVTASGLDVFYRGDPNLGRVLAVASGVITLSVLLLSMAGISAMMSFAVTRQRREIGIRTALGATRGRIIRRIFTRATRQLGVGLLIGLALAALMDRMAAGQVLDDQATPILVFVGVIMVASGLVAAMGPARRALGVQPMEALKEE